LLFSAKTEITSHQRCSSERFIKVTYLYAASILDTRWFS